MYHPFAVIAGSILLAASADGVAAWGFVSDNGWAAIGTFFISAGGVAVTVFKAIGDSRERRAVIELELAKDRITELESRWVEVDKQRADERAKNDSLIHELLAKGLLKTDPVTVALASTPVDAVLLIQPSGDAK